MSLIVPPGYSNVTFEFANASAVGSKPVFSIGISAPPTEDYLDGFEAWYDSDYRPLLDQTQMLQRIVMRNEVAEAIRIVNSNGSDNATFTSPQVTALVQKVTGQVGRTNRGRMNLFGVLPEALVDQGGVIQGARVTSLQGTMDSLMDLATSTGDELVLFHNGSSDPTIISSLVVSPQTATIRRRNRK